MKTVIMAGGRGTRIASINSEVPKPMIQIVDKPILEYQIECLKRQGFTDIILVVGYLGDQIIDYFKDGSGISPATSHPFGVHIEYVYEKEPLGTAGSFSMLKDKISDDCFLLLNGDIIFDVDLKRFLNFYKESGGLAAILTHPNGHPYDSGIIEADPDGLVTNWLHKEDKRTWYKNRVNAGIHLLSKTLLAQEQFSVPKKTDLDREVLKPLISEKKLYCYDSPEYIKDMGTPDRYFEVTEDILSGKVHSKNLSVPQKAVFLDRDGTINKYVGFLTDIDKFELLPGVSEAIRMINQSGYLAIVVTNQPVIARGELTFEQLELIHKKMETLLGKEGAYLDAVYVCPHHPDSGFKGEIKELKIDCNCRKPKPGLLLKAAEKFNISLPDSYMVGDDQRDVKCGENAGCKSVLLSENGAGYKNVCNNLLDFARQTFKK